MKKLPTRELPTVTQQKTVAQSRIFRIEQLDLRFSNGVEVEYERLRGSGPPTGAVLIVPMLDEHTVLLIREYAAGVMRYELALPKGKLEIGEDMLDGANREIMEEVGYASNKLTHLSTVTLAPGYLSHQTHIVLAEDLYEKREPGDEPEEIDVVPWSLKKLPELFAQAECTEARSIAALYMVRDRLLAGEC